MLRGCFNPACVRRRVVAVVDLEDEEDDVKHEEAPPAAAGDAADAHGTPELIAPATIEAQLAAEVCVKLSAEPFLRKLVSPNPHHSPLTSTTNH